MLKQKLDHGIEKIKLAATKSSLFKRAIAAAEIFIQAGNHKQASALIASAKSLYGPALAFDLWFRRAIATAKLNRIDDAVAAMRQAYAILPENPSVIYALGSLLACRREFEEADKLFAKDVPVMTGTGSPTYTRALRFKHDFLSSSQPPPRIVEPLASAALGSNDWTTVYLVASDSVYFERYAQALARSVEIHGGGRILIYFHVVNANAQTYNIFSALSKRHPNVRGAVETFDFGNLSEIQRKTYYSCVRYLVLAEIMSEFAAPIVVADIDQMLVSDPEPLFLITGAADVALLRFDNQCHNLFSFLSATLMVVQPTAGAANFVNALASNVRRSISNPQNMTWHLDQAALAVTYLSEDTVKYSFIPDSIVHLGSGEPIPGRPADVGIFWSITNSIPENLKKIETATFSGLMRS